MKKQVHLILMKPNIILDEKQVRLNFKKSFINHDEQYNDNNRY